MGNQENSDSGICEHHFRKVCGQGFFEQKLSFEGRHLFDSLNKPAAKRSAAVVDQDVGTGRFI
jgi:hypothetical protein